MLMFMYAWELLSPSPLSPKRSRMVPSVLDDNNRLPKKFFMHNTAKIKKNIK